MFENLRNKISEWFSIRNDRTALLKNFNNLTRLAFVNGDMPAMLNARISSGNSSYRHEFSRWNAGGFRIKVMAGRNLTKEEMFELGTFIIFNNQMVRELVSLVFDTLELHSDVGNIGLQWELKKHIKMLNELY